MWPQLIDAQLANPMMRPGKTPPFVPKNVVENDHRLKRVRQWNDRGVETRILPWLGLNPSGFDKTGQGLSGRTMARLAHMWGFDGVATYNLLPFEGSKPKKDIWPILQKGEHHEIVATSYEYIAKDLLNSDALVVGWGKQSGPFGIELDHLARRLVSTINKLDHRNPIELWHVGLNSDRSPKHAGARGVYRIADDAQPTRFNFR